MKIWPLFIGSEKVQTSEKIPVHDKYSKEIIAEVSLANENIVEEAIQKAAASEEKMRRLSSYERREILQFIWEKITERKKEFSETLVKETGKPIRDAETEVNRALDTFRLAMEESTRLYGEVLPLDISPRSQGYRGFTTRFPVGTCLFITPFNFPLNLLAHKVAPAIAVGCPFIAKPASFTPLSALLLGEILSESPLPKGCFSILPAKSSLIEKYIPDERIKLLSFTGSAKVGWKLKELAFRKKVLLELGGNAAVIICESANVDRAVERTLFGAFYQAGQSCISVQRIYVHEKRYFEFLEKFLEKVKNLVSGNPFDEKTFLGPLISEEEAIRIESWVNEALQTGAKLLCGGKRMGSFYEATLLENVPLNAAISCEEAFGPVALVQKFSHFPEAINFVNQSKYGLQAGIFTENLKEAFMAWQELEVGGVVINDVPSFRVDSMPYGGIKESGFGREGIRYAIEEMSEIRLMVLYQER